jgi:hypothetical protein
MRKKNPPAEKRNGHKLEVAEDAVTEEIEIEIEIEVAKIFENEIETENETENENENEIEIEIEIARRGAMCSTDHCKVHVCNAS